MLVDENCSPSISSGLWAEDIDNFALRDRGLLGSPDHEVWELAQRDQRTIVTIDIGDFERFAERSPTHFGILTIPAGTLRDKQLGLVMQGVQFIRSQNRILPSFRDQIVAVAEFGEVTAKTVTSERVLAFAPAIPKIVS
jgi:predicted nuclease of predicted toxin-antitoxin system